MPKTTNDPAVPLQAARPEPPAVPPRAVPAAAAPTQEPPRQKRIAPAATTPAILRPPLRAPIMRASRMLDDQVDSEGMPIIIAEPKIRWCLKCQMKFDPKVDKSHKRHLVRDHHPKGLRKGVVASDDTTVSASSEARYAVGVNGWDKCLGGGFVRGSGIILGGKTGCGKSTLAREVCYLVCAKLHGVALYVSGEETEGQILLGLRTGGLTHKNFKVVQSSSFEDVERLVVELKPDVIVLDSINRIMTMHAPGAKAGSIQAIDAMASRIVHLCKKTRLKPIVIAIGHETKDGDIAGPQSALHDLDVVLHFRIDGSRRILETEKNRFGEAPVSATFEFKGKRLVEVKDAAARILPTITGGIGCTLFASVIGVGASALAVEVFASNPRKPDDQPPSVRATGIADDKFRDIVDAVATHTSVDTKDRSIKAKVRVPNDAANTSDKAIDAAFVVALASAVEKLALPSDLAVFGELSPSGRLEFDPNAEARVIAAKNAKARTILGPLGAPAVEGINYIAMPDIRSLVSWVRANCEFVGDNAETIASVNSDAGKKISDDASRVLSDVHTGGSGG